MALGMNAETVLNRAPEVDMSLQTNGEVEFWQGDHVHRGSALSLAVLDAFRYPRKLGEVVGELRPRLSGPLALDDLLADVSRLLSIGIMRRGERQARFSQKPYPFGFYDSPGVHIRILNDRQRRCAFLKAVQAVVQPGDVVLDLGTGSGILAVAAVRAGAKHVYAVEPSNMAAFAREVFRHNNIDDQVTVVDDWSQFTTLPELADVLTFDLVGSQALDMRLSEICSDAVVRLLKPNARLIPNRLDFGIYLVELPDDVRAQFVFTDKLLAEWKSWYGIDFQPLVSQCAPPDVCSAFITPHEASQLLPVSPPEILWSLDLKSQSDIPTTPVQGTVEANADAKNIAVVGFTRAHLGEEVEYTTMPQDCGPSPHWMTPLWIPAFPRPVRSGESVTCQYQYHGRGRVEVRLHDSCPCVL